MVISLIHPSRGRPEKAFVTANKWMKYAGGAHVEHIFSLDSSDPTAGQYAPIQKIIINDNDCVVQATNHAAKEATGDVLIYLSDDFDCFEEWAEKIVVTCRQYTGEYVLKVNDGLQDFRSEVLTIPIMSKALYNRLGYFFYPEYKSMWVDVDLFHTCNKLGVIKWHRDITFQHNHYCNGKSQRDDTYTRSDGFWNQGKEVIAKRRKQGFA